LSPTAFEALPGGHVHDQRRADPAELGAHHPRRTAFRPLAVCIREVQKSLMQSSKRLIESKIHHLGVGSTFKILHDRIITPGWPDHFPGHARSHGRVYQIAGRLQDRVIEEAQTFSHSC
jgi:hypothetical protein